MPLIKYGFSLADIEKLYNEYDCRLLPNIFKLVAKQNSIDLLRNKLIVSESINFGYIGSKPDKRKKNQKEYAKWQRKQLKQIAKLEGRKIESNTFWDRFKKKKKSRKF